jgi:spore germination protein KA
MMKEGKRVRQNPSIEAAETYFNQLFSEQSDFQSKQLLIGGTVFTLFYFDTLVDSSLVQDFILQPLASPSSGCDPRGSVDS